MSLVVVKSGDKNSRSKISILMFSIQFKEIGPNLSICGSRGPSVSDSFSYLDELNSYMYPEDFVSQWKDEKDGPKK